MPAITLFLILFCLYACKEKTQEYDVWFELNKPEAGSLNDSNLHHLGGGLCIYKGHGFYYFGGGNSEWTVSISSCYDSLPIDTKAPAENITKYRQGGLCLSHDCIVKPEESLTVFISAPMGYIDPSNKYNVLASKHSDSVMLYRYEKNPIWYTWYRRINGSSEFDERYIPWGEQSAFTLFKKHDEFWEELFSIAKPLEVKGGDFPDRCSNEFCSTKDILKPLHEIKCAYGTKNGHFKCLPEEEGGKLGRRIKPKCFEKLERLSWEYGLLLHSGAFPAGDCDLGNWRYIKIDSLGGKHREKLKSLLMPPDSVQLYEPGS